MRKIRGLDHFTKYFEDYSNDFTLIGGVANYILSIDASATSVRMTKDLDILVMMQSSDEFLAAIKSYVKEGEYETQVGHNDQTSFYRFKNPSDDNYPEMIELFAAADNNFELFDDQRIIPASSSKDIDSLSAILLDKDYYSLLKRHCIKKNGVNIIDELALIPFKANAYLDIKKEGGDSKKWAKHRRDIINLTVIRLNENTREELQGKIRDHFIQFINQVEPELTSEIIKGACGEKISKEVIISTLKKTFL